MSADLLAEQHRHLARLLEAIQRCAWFLHESDAKIDWPIEAGWLGKHKKDVELFETLAAINERFAKLQDSLASAMRHSALLMGEPTDSFLKVLAFFEKQEVIDTMADWQRCRAVRNMAAHDYATDYGEIAEHFNLLHELSGLLFQTARKLIQLCHSLLGIEPASSDFTDEFERIFA
ncbi:hypothetical protein HOP52_13815 [Halomonas campisalis]|uniref:DUF86 domain-containing protein n=1 Tax=Billgrantia campisalis TaxID=74661 RepID=A0ABS9PAN9_9GAMM|nr:hypothetical protein [Halomonas campisalis]MCG6658832.1 hypothetical protein [Halomonas campisalis]MDR5864519.1 hypothetical protein [Halomonas campisalis]